MFAVFVKFGKNPHVTNVMRRYAVDAQPFVQDVLNRVADDKKFNGQTLRSCCMEQSSLCLVMLSLTMVY